MSCLRVPVRQLLAAGVVAFATLALGVAPARADHFPASDADSIPLLATTRGTAGYWWDHSDLTVAVRAAPTVPADFLEIAHDAIEVWDDALRHYYGGVITLTDVSGDPSAATRADIVVHYVPRFGGVILLGTAHCSGSGSRCNNVIVQSDVPQTFPGDSTPEEFLTLVLHELGHALGLGHTNPLGSVDVMGYSWIGTGQGVPLSDCDMEAVGAVFAWALEGTAPRPPSVTEVLCSA